MVDWASEVAKKYANTQMERSRTESCFVALHRLSEVCLCCLYNDNLPCNPRLHWRLRSLDMGSGHPASFLSLLHLQSSWFKLTTYTWYPSGHGHDSSSSTKLCCNFLGVLFWWQAWMGTCNFMFIIHNGLKWHVLTFSSHASRWHETPCHQST